MSSPHEQVTYRMEIQRVSDGTFFPAGEVPAGYMQEGRDQTVFLGQRRGVVGPDASDIAVVEEPVFAEDKLIAGVSMTVNGSSNGRAEKIFTLDLFADYARMRALGLAKQGLLEKDTKYSYRVFADMTNGNGTPASAAGVVAKVRRKPLPLVPGKLADWLPHAKPVGPMIEGDFPLFFTERALELSREYSRKPGDKEGGAMMLGTLYQQTEPEPEIFAVVDDVLEARYAEQQTLSLDLTTETWAYFQTQLALRRTRLGKVNELPIAFGHGHNFVPQVKEGAEPCGECHLRGSCAFSSSFYSTRDTEFHRALFCRQPYAVGLVWGYTTKKEDDLKVFCLEGSQPRRRGYYQVVNT
jgi:hypothetical protein